MARRPIRPIDVRLLEATDHLLGAAKRLHRANGHSGSEASYQRYRAALSVVERAALNFARLAQQAGGDR